MYSYFRGQVTEIHATHIIFEVNQVGYRILEKMLKNYLVLLLMRNVICLKT